MNEIEYLRNLIQHIKREQIKFTEVCVNLNHAEDIPLWHNLLCYDVGEVSICQGILIMGQSIPKSEFLVIGNRGQNLLSFISLPTIPKPTMLSDDAPDDVVIIELEGSLRLITDSNSDIASASATHNMVLISCFKEIRKLAETTIKESPCQIK